MSDRCSMPADTEVAPHDLDPFARMPEALLESLRLSMERCSLSTVRYCIERDGYDPWASLLPDGQLAA